ncbi:MAG: hypothetical protein ABI873_08475 [Marmoricola sp.]
MRPEPDFLRHLVDDAAIFPPGNVPLERAVAEHQEHRAAPYAALVGGFVVSDTRLADLANLVSADQPLGINVVVTGGAGAIEPAVRWATRADGLQLLALEIALRDEDDLARNAARVVAMVGNLRDAVPDAMGEGVAIYVEPPRTPDGPSHGWLAALDEIAMAGLRLKFRTGGATADAFPSTAELAASIDAALDRETPFKCTAGLHDAVHHVDPETGFEHHGFLNVLLATRVALDGGDVQAALATEEPAGLLPSPEASASARRWFTSFGSCSVLDVHEDLVDLGLWTDHQEEGTR